MLFILLKQALARYVNLQIMSKIAAGDIIIFPANKNLTVLAMVHERVFP